ncbi:hypothetical protein VTP01DRAFT_2422 [Rhizomucor pusillus]|uniref:uncharacterized protein n=1 Tax=Rhizomucor pusillus TaxID=4840 RepID=UPI00374337B5
MSTALADPLSECIEEWNRIKRESSNVLAAIDPADPERTRHLVLESVAQFRQVLEHMYEEYDKVVEAHEAKVADGGGQACTEHPPDLLALKRRIDMYDNEYMVKETIGSIVSEPGFFTRQHLTGCNALWTTEPYLT